MGSELAVSDQEGDLGVLVVSSIVSTQHEDRLQATMGTHNLLVLEVGYPCRAKWQRDMGTLLSCVLLVISGGSQSETQEAGPNGPLARSSRAFDFIAPSPPLESAQRHQH